MKTEYIEFESKALGKMRILHSGDMELTQIIVEEIYSLCVYKPLVTALKKVKNPIVVDIGAHIGLASLYFTQIPNVKIHAIEPNPYNFHMLKENTKDFPQITAHNVAIGGIDAKRTLSGDKMAESFYMKGENNIKVQGITLKTFMNYVSIDHIDGVKIDCEGEEYAIFLLPAFKEIAHKIDFIIGESHMKPGIPQMIPELLKPLGFNVKFLPYKNILEYYDLMLEDKKHYRVEAQLNTMFTAKRI